MGCQPEHRQAVAGARVQIIWTRHALGDLGRLHAFLEPVNPAAAAAVFVKLSSAPDLLLNQPRIGSPIPGFAPRDVRRWLVGDYELRYEVAQDAIWILSLWHTREDR